MIKTKRHLILKILPLVILAGVLVPGIIYAADLTPEEVAKYPDTGSEWLKNGIIWTLGQIADGCGWLIGVAGTLLDLAIDYSVGPKSASLYNIGIVTNGWAICRNITNIFFIFALIFIGIATILQLSNYDYKKIIPGIIIAALLVNFSMVITKMIIDSSNVLAMEFVCKMTGGSCLTEKISTTMSQGLKFSSMENWASKESLIKVFGENAKSKLMLANILRAGLYLMTAFILLAGAFFFVIRTVFLIILIIFSPLALAASAIKINLPTGKFTSNTWWSRLISQSFFAPAYLFMLYLVLSFISELGDAFQVDGKSFANLLGGSDKIIETIPLVLNFFIAGALLIGALVVAKSIGGMSAGYGMAGASWVKRKAQGYAGKIGGATGRFAARQTVGRAAEATVHDKEGKERAWIGRMQVKSPRAGGWAADKLRKAPATFGRKEKIETLVQRGMALSPKDRAEYLEKLGKGILGDRQAQLEMFKRMPARERSQLLETKPSFDATYKKLLETLSIEEKEKTLKSTGETRLANFIGKLWDEKQAKSTINDNEFKELHEKLSWKNVQDKIVDEGGKIAEEYFKSLKKFGDTAEEVAQKLQDMGNKSQASGIRGPAGQNVMKAYGFEIEQKPKKSAGFTSK